MILSYNLFNVDVNFWRLHLGAQIDIWLKNEGR